MIRKRRHVRATGQGRPERAVLDDFLEAAGAADPRHLVKGCGQAGKSAPAGLHANLAREAQFQTNHGIAPGRMPATRHMAAGFVSNTSARIHKMKPIWPVSA